MASNTKNVKLGVCKVFFDGVDLGYTKGGVEVTVKTDTHKVNVDQFGKTSINEYIMGRDVQAKVPLAETTLENMVAIMPGATLTEVGGTVASGSFTFTSAAPANNDSITVNGVVFTWKTVPVVGVETDLPIAATHTAAATALAVVLNASTNPLIAAASYVAAGGVLTIKWGSQLGYGLVGKVGLEGNAFTTVKVTGTNIAVAGATLTGGTDATSKKVDVTTGIGTDLLSIAKELRLHPTAKAADDFSEDFVVPLAATAGALNFAYKLEDERVFNVEFTGYPDSVTGKLFYVGA